MCCFSNAYAGTESKICESEGLCAVVRIFCMSMRTVLHQFSRNLCVAKSALPLVANTIVSMFVICFAYFDKIKIVLYPPRCDVSSAEINFEILRCEGPCSNAFFFSMMPRWFWSGHSHCVSKWPWPRLGDDLLSQPASGQRQGFLTSTSRSRYVYWSWHLKAWSGLLSFNIGDYVSRGRRLGIMTRAAACQHFSVLRSPWSSVTPQHRKKASVTGATHRHCPRYTGTPSCKPWHLTCKAWLWVHWHEPCLQTDLSALEEDTSINPQSRRYMPFGFYGMLSCSGLYVCPGLYRQLPSIEAKKTEVHVVHLKKWL